MVSKEPVNRPEVSLQYVNENCWRRPFVQDLIVSSCSKQSDETRSRLALAITNCHLEASGMDGVECAQGEAIQHCRKRVGQSAMAFQTYTTCYYNIDSMCYFMQRDKFQQSTEEAINGLYNAGMKSVETMYVLRDTMQEFAEEEKSRFDQLLNQSQQVEGLHLQNLAHLSLLNTSVHQQYTSHHHMLDKTTGGIMELKNKQEDQIQRSNDITLSIQSAVPLVEGVVLELSAILQQVGGIKAGMQGLQKDQSNYQAASDQFNVPAAWFYGTTVVGTLWFTSFAALSAARWHQLGLTTLAYVLERAFTEMAVYFHTCYNFLIRFFPSYQMNPQLTEWQQTNYNQTTSFIGSTLFNELDLHASTNSMYNTHYAYPNIWVAIYRAVYVCLFIFTCIYVMIYNTNNTNSTNTQEEAKQREIIARMDVDIRGMSERLDMLLQHVSKQHPLLLLDVDTTQASNHTNMLTYTNSTNTPNLGHVEPETTPLSIKSKSFTSPLPIIMEEIDTRQISTSTPVNSTSEEKEENVFQQTAKYKRPHPAYNMSSILDDLVITDSSSTNTNTNEKQHSSTRKRKTEALSKDHVTKKQKTSAIVEDDMVDTPV